MYRLTLLGGVSLRGPSGPVWGRVIQGHCLALLALLVRRPGTPLTREKAAGLLWGARPEARARARLSDTLYRLRQELGNEAILSVADGLYLDGEVVSSDVAAFDDAMEAARWREAVELYQGPFLDGFHLEGAPEFERWLERERRRLSMRHREALEELAGEAEGAEAWPEAVTWWRQRLAQDPTNTPVVLRLMKVLATSGHVAGAVKEARMHERRLRDDLDLPLPQEVRALVDELTQEARRDPADASEPSKAPSEPSRGPAEPTAVLEDQGTSQPASAAVGRRHGDALDERTIPAGAGTAARSPGAPSPPSPTNPAPDKRRRPRRWVAAGGVLAAITVLATGWFFGIGVGGEAGDRAAADLEAYDHYLQGRSYVVRQFSEDAARAAIAQYERAVELDPGLAAAWRRLIETRLWLTWVVADEEAGLRAAEDLAHLLELDSDDPEVRLGRAWFLYYGERRYDEALREFGRVRESRPRDPEVLRVIGFLQTRMGYVERAVETLGEALEVTPRDAELAFAIGHAHRILGRYAEAERYYQRAISLAPDMGFAYGWLSVVQLARGDTARGREARERAWELGANPPLGEERSDLYEGDLVEAVERLRSRPAIHQISRMFRYDALADAYGRMGQEERRTAYADSLQELASSVAPEDWDRPRAQAANLGWVFSGLALIHLGEPDRGLEQVRRGLELEAPFGDILVGSLVRTTAARAFVRTGEYEEAIGLLEEAWAAASYLSPYSLRHDPEWEPLRDHPQFQSLLEVGPRG